MYFFLAAYSILGAGIKYIDDAFDEKTFNKKYAYIIAPLLGILWAYAMIINPVSATILLAVLCGVFFKGKIDNYAHLVGLLVIVGIILLANVQLLLLPLVFLAASALLDEIGNDAIEKYRKRLSSYSFRHLFVIKFFDHRWMMKIAILVLTIFGVIPVFFFIAMLIFDYSYLTVRLYSQYKQGKSDSWKHLKSYKIRTFISSTFVLSTSKIEEQHNL